MYVLDASDPEAVQLQPKKRHLAAKDEAHEDEEEQQTLREQHAPYARSQRRSWRPGWPPLCAAGGAKGATPNRFRQNPSPGSNCRPTELICIIHFNLSRLILSRIENSSSNFSEVGYETSRTSAQ